mgnify:CR=1 FL=1
MLAPSVLSPRLPVHAHSARCAVCMHGEVPSLGRGPKNLLVGMMLVSTLTLGPLELQAADQTPLADTRATVAADVPHAVAGNSWRALTGCLRPGFPIPALDLPQQRRATDGAT